MSDLNPVPKCADKRLDVKRMMEFAQVNIVLQNVPNILENTAKKIERAHKILHRTEAVKDPATGEVTTADAEISGNDMEIVKLSDKAEERLLQSIGVIPSKSVSVMIGKIVQQNNVVIPPEALSVLRELSNTSDVVDLKRLGMEGSFEEYGEVEGGMA